VFSKFGPIHLHPGGYQVFTKPSEVDYCSFSLLDQEKDVT